MKWPEAEGLICENCHQIPPTIHVTGDSNPATDNTELQRLKYSEKSRIAEENQLPEIAAKADIEVRNLSLTPNFLVVSSD